MTSPFHVFLDCSDQCFADKTIGFCSGAPQAQEEKLIAVSFEEMYVQI